MYLLRPGDCDVPGGVARRNCLVNGVAYDLLLVKARKSRPGERERLNCI